MRMPMPRSSGQVASSGFTGGGLSVYREREHEHAARLPETGHGELARADEAPGRGERLELLLGPAALHGEKAAVRSDEPPHLRKELRQRCDRARDDRVEGFGRVHRLDSRLKRRHVREPERGWAAGRGGRRPAPARARRPPRLPPSSAGRSAALSSTGLNSRVVARSGAGLIILRRCGCGWWETRG